VALLMKMLLNLGVALVRETGCRLTTSTRRANPCKQFLSLIPRDATPVGESQGPNEDGTTDVALVDGGTVTVRGEEYAIGLSLDEEPRERAPVKGLHGVMAMNRAQKKSPGIEQRLVTLLTGRMDPALNLCFI